MSSTNNDATLTGGNGRMLFGVPKLMGKGNYMCCDTAMPADTDASALKQWVNGESMERHFAHTRQLTLQLTAIGEPIPDISLIVRVKASLPSLWDTITFILNG
ncbi:hypothetical protein JCM10450v2_000912 [Rhodotorula kratochvilovae]